jgi:hypothetical protein
MLVAIASAQNEPEAEMICARLAGAGIDAMYKRGIGADLPQLGGSGIREVFVDEVAAARARELLSVPEFSDEELAELSARAAEGPAGESPQ